MTPDRPGPPPARGAHPLLALETTQRTGGVALGLPDGRVLADRFAPAKRHDDRLMPAVDALCRRAGLGPRDLRAVAVSLGPGGFSGLRIGLATVKMLARALDLRTVGVPSALVVAEAAAGLHAGSRRVLVVLASKREHAWLTVLERPAADAAAPWTIAADPAPRAGHAADVPWTSLDAVLADEHLPASFVAAAAAAGVPVVPPTFDPVACLAVARRRLAADPAGDDPLALAPIYPGPPEAVVRWNARQGAS